MSRRQSSADAVRRTAVWFLVLAVFIGPLGLGTSLASAATTGCGAACPCDEEPGEAEHGEPGDDCGEPGDSRHGDEEGPGDDCPPDCQDCSCGAGAMLGLVAVLTPEPQLSSTSFATLEPAETPALVDRSSVFRPPRSLS